MPCLSAPELSESEESNPSVRAFAISAFCARYSICRTKAYQEIAAGRLRAVKAGRKTLITVEAAEAWLAQLPDFSR